MTDPLTTEQKLDRILEFLEKDTHRKKWLIVLGAVRIFFVLLPWIILFGGVIYAYTHVDVLFDTIVERMSEQIPSVPDAVRPGVIIERVKEYLPE